MQEALQKMFQESNWKYRFMAIRLKNDWEMLMGKTVAKHTTDLMIQDHKLHIYTDVAPLKHELSYNKQLLLEKINQYLGETFIRDVIVH